MERLHLDLIAGARADMISGALVAVGAPLDAALEALAQVGLGRLDLVADEAARAGLNAVRLRVLVDGADLAAFVRAGAAPSPRSHRGARHRHHTAKPRLETRGGEAPLVAAATASAVQDTRGAGGMVDDRAVLAGARNPGRRRSSRTPAAPEKWLAGQDVPAAALVDVLKESDLEPIPKALALKAARRLVDALSLVSADAAKAKLRGVAAARLLADVVTGAAFVSALSPSSVTSSPIGISSGGVDDEGLTPEALWPAPSPWLLEVLAGVPVVEHDDDLVTVDVAGAALVWAIAHRFGARGLSTSTKQGAGASAVDAPGRALVARALLGPPPFVATRSGAREVSAAVVVEGTAPRDVDVAALGRALRPITGGDLEIQPTEQPRGVRVRALVAVAGTGGSVVDDVTDVLWRAGCVDVVASWVERRRPGVEEVTVPIGRGRTKASVRVRVLTNGDEILRIDPDMDDVHAAAARRGESAHAIAAIAVESARAAAAARGTRASGKRGRP